MSTGNTEGKGSSGARFKIPPAAIWNNMVDAGRAWADDRLSSQGGTPIRPRATDIIKIQNTSGDARRTGEILKIEGKALDTIVAEHIWLLGIAPTADCYFGILKKPAEVDGVEDLQVSGCCMALIDITDADHTRADVVAGEYVLTSAVDGPIEILFAPSGTGEKECVVRFSGGSGSGSGSGSGCPCVCINEGDIEVEGIITTSIWTVQMPAVLFVQAEGTITFPAGPYTLTWDSGSSTWTLDIGSFLTAAYNDASDATADTTMDGTLTMSWTGGVAEINLCVDGTIPAP